MEAVADTIKAATEEEPPNDVNTDKDLKEDDPVLWKKKIETIG